MLVNGKYRKVLILIILLLGFTLSLQLSYSFWQIESKDTNLGVVEDECINIIYSDDLDFNLIKPQAIKDDDGPRTTPKSIAITNNCSTSKTVEVGLNVLKTSSLDSDKIKVYINGDVTHPADYVSNYQLLMNNDPDILEKKSPLKESDSITASLKKLESVAEKTQDEGLLKLAQTVKKRAKDILADNIKLEEDNAAKEKELEQVRQESEVRKKQVYFLSGAANQNVTNLLSGFHTVYTLTDAIKGNINFLREELSKGRAASEETILMIIGEIYQTNEKAHKLADLAIHGNQTLKQDGSNSIYDFIRQYIDADLAIKGIEYILTPNGDKAFNCKFDTSSIGVILDNISSNSIKAGATKLYISLEEKKKYVEVIFTDNGIGLDDDIDIDMLFEWGVSNNVSKKGFGIGLYHIKQLVEEMKGTVTIDNTYKDGFRLVVKLKR